MISKLGRFMMGFGGAFAFVGTLKLSSIWFPPTRFGLLAGMTQALGMAGAAVGEAPVSVLVGHIGWRDTIWLFAAVFIVLAIFIGIVVRDYPPKYFHKPANKKIEMHSVCSGIKIVLTNSQTWINCGYIGFLYASSAAFAELWGVSFYRQLMLFIVM